MAKEDYIQIMNRVLDEEDQAPLPYKLASKFEKIHRYLSKVSVGTPEPWFFVALVALMDDEDSLIQEDSEVKNSIEFEEQEPCRIINGEWKEFRGVILGDGPKDTFKVRLDDDPDPAKKYRQIPRSYIDKA